MDQDLPVVRISGHTEDIHVSGVKPLKDNVFVMSGISGVGGFFAMMICAFIGILMMAQGDTPMQIFGGVFIGGGFLLFLAGMIFMTIAFTAVFYKGWKVIQVARFLHPEETIDMPTPATAVALNFVPIFVFYWAFVACFGLEKYGRMVSQAKDVPYIGPSRELCMWVPLLFIIGTVCSNIPYIGSFIGGTVNLALLITYIVLLSKVNKMVRQLGDAYTIRTVV